MAEKIKTTIIITDGPHPITICQDGTTTTIPVPLIDIKGNTLGAGDFVLSASIYYMIKYSLPLQQAITKSLEKIPVLLGKNHGHVGPGEQLALFIKRLTSTAETDPLTSLFNRRGLQNFYETDGLQNQRVAAVIIDIDYFKSVNDKFGHDVGDAVIREIGAILRQHLRQGDAACRWGGEEFVFLTINTAKDYLIPLVERLRETISLHNFEALNEHITISAGIALPKPQDGLDTLIKRADQALYKAKESGRNQVKVG